MDMSKKSITVFILTADNLSVVSDLHEYVNTN
jgi:hypothetical protein